MAAVRFRTNTPAVTAQVIEGEVILLNLHSGVYYSLVGSGAEIWSLIQARATVDEIVSEMASRYTGEPAVTDAVLRLLGQLREESLIIPLEPGAAPPADADPVGGNSRGGVRGGFQAPVLQKFSEMQEMLLLDPIHEVDATGWPHVKPGSGQ